MKTKAISTAGGKVMRILLALLIAIPGLAWMAKPGNAYVSGEQLDFRQYDSNTGNSWADNIMYIDGEIAMCIDVTTTVKMSTARVATTCCSSMRKATSSTCRSSNSTASHATSAPKAATRA